MTEPVDRTPLGIVLDQIAGDPTRRLLYRAEARLGVEGLRPASLANHDVEAALHERIAARGRRRGKVPDDPDRLRARVAELRAAAEWATSPSEPPAPLRAVGG